MNDFLLIASGLLIAVLVYGAVVAIAMRRELRELEAEMQRNLGPVPEGWDAVRRIDEERAK